MARALPLNTVSPSHVLNALVIAARIVAAPFRHAGAVVALALIAGACTGDSAAGTPKRAGKSAGSPGGSNESSGDVVIRPESTPYKVGIVSATGSVMGTVSLRNTLEQLPAVSTGRDSAMCGPSIPDESLQVRSGAIAGAVVWLEGVRTGKSPGLERRVELESDRCRLAPRVQAAVVGSAVNIIGHDNLLQHLTFQVSGESAPRASIQLGGGEQVIPTELPFTSPGMVSVRDTAHAWSRAYLAVFDHPYFAVTATGGTFTIDSVPPGKYTLHAWHERTGVTRHSVDVAANGAAKVAIALESEKP